MIKVSTNGMVVSLKTDLRFPKSGQQGHGPRIIQISHILCDYHLQEDDNYGRLSRNSEA